MTDDPSTYDFDLDDLSPRRSARRRDDRRRTARRRAQRNVAIVMLGVPAIVGSFVVGLNILGGSSDVSVNQAAAPAATSSSRPAAKAPVSGPKVSLAASATKKRSTGGTSRETVRTPAAGGSSSTTTSAAPRTTTSTTRKPAPSTTSTSKKPVASGSGTTSTSDEAEVLRLVNVERASAGCPALKASSTLASVARAHSKDMAVNGYFDHNSQNGTTPFQRMTAAGYTYSMAAENIAAGQPTPAAVMDSWMHSAGHKANILNCGLKELGVGVWTQSGSPYGIYWTQDFGTPR